MSQFELSRKSMRQLRTVHPDLQRVTKRAIELTRIDFGVSEGLRSASRQLELVAQRKSTTENSKHLIQEDGYGHAIDIYAFYNGKVNWTNRVYGPIIQAFITAAIEEGVQVIFGHLWLDLFDSVHIELNEEHYS